MFQKVCFDRKDIILLIKTKPNLSRSIQTFFIHFDDSLIRFGTSVKKVTALVCSDKTVPTTRFDAELNKQKNYLSKNEDQMIY